MSVPYLSARCVRLWFALLGSTSRTLPSSGIPGGAGIGVDILRLRQELWLIDNLDQVKKSRG